MKNNIVISDVTLRDGNHAVFHQIDKNSIQKYCIFAEKANIPIIEVGHGMGLGGSSLLIGISKVSDNDMLKIAKKFLKKTKLSVHIVPGLATIKSNILPAIEIGVDIFRIAVHCTEVTLAQTHVEYCLKHNKTVWGVLMMSATISKEELVKQAILFENYGVSAIIIMDTTGSFLPKDITNLFSLLSKKIKVELGFHGHNNLGCALMNSIAAIENGATIIDVCIKGFGAGAGNTSLEMFLPILSKYGYQTNINFKDVINESDNISKYLIKKPIYSSPINILTAIYKLSSTYENIILKYSKKFQINYFDLIYELRNHKLVGMQEDIIISVAKKISNQ